MTKKLLLAFSGLLMGSVLFAQSIPDFIPTKRAALKCKTDESHHSLYNSDPIYRANFDNSQLQVRNIINSGIRVGGVYTIPVVVHVMHLGSAEGTNENISDAQIQSAIDNLNDAYNNLGYNGLDIDIEFALAVRDPNCQATDGINRINASSLTSGGDAYATMGATDNNRTALKALSNWSNSDYYNIWIVTEIDNNNGGAGTQGYAYFPGAPNGTDGAVILYNAFGYDPTLSLGYELKSYTNYNTTAIHELGHGLDLFHTFEGDDANDDGTPDTCPPTAAGSGDECGDTHAHRRDDSDCQGGIDPTCNGVAGSTVFNNFMAYSSDICQDRFTADQKLRMRAAMEGPRASLLTSLALTTAPPQAPNTLANSCSPVSSSLPNEGVTDYYGGILSVTFGNRTSVTGATKDDHDDFGTFGYMDFSQDCLKYDEFEEGATIGITVGCHFNNHNVKVYVDWNNNGVFGAGEEALSLNTVGYTPSSGNIVIPGGAVTSEFLRIRFNADIGTVGSACEDATYGQIEDYAIFINPAGGSAPVAQFSANSTSVCSGSSIIFTSSSTDATTYSWDFGTNASPATATGVGPHSVTYTGSGTSTVTLDVTGPGGSDNETKTNYITRNSNVTPSVSIVASANPITSGDPVTFTATPTNGGTPSYQWKLNAGNVGSNSSTYNNSSLANGDQVHCVITSTATCASPTTATSNTITMTVNPGGSCSTDIAGPGGVGNQLNNEIWLDASNISGTLNGGVLATWQDRSGNARNVNQTTFSRRPTYLSSGINNKPVVDFDGLGDYLNSGVIADLNTSNLSWFIIAESDNLAQTGFMISNNYTSGSGSSSTHLWGSYTTGGGYKSFARNNTGTVQVIDQGNNAGFQIVSNVWNGATDQLSGFINGNSVPIKNGLTANPTGHKFLRIGSRSDAPNFYFDGRIAEIIVYSQALNEAERIIVDNYLGAKYNLPLTTNDKYSFESTHSNDAAGIGMISGVSSPSGRGNIVEMNSASSLANGDFIMFAHNNATTNPTTTGTPSAYGGTGEMMTRVWRADKTNDVGTVTVNFYLDGIATGGSTNFELLNDADGNFTNATRITSGFSYDSNCDIATWTGVNFTDGDYFTIGNPDGAALFVAPIIETEASIEVSENLETEAATLEIFDSSTDEVKMKLYPNPTSGSLTIENIMEGAAVEIYNSLGQLVYNSAILMGRNQYDFSYLNAGIYIVHLKDINNETISISQLMIQK